MDGSYMMLEAVNESWPNRSLEMASAKHIVGTVVFYGRRP